MRSARDLAARAFRAGSVQQLVDAFLPARLHTAVWDGRNGAGRRASSGVYVVPYSDSCARTGTVPSRTTNRTAVFGARIEGLRARWYAAIRPGRPPSPSDTGAGKPLLRRAKCQGFE